MTTRNLLVCIDTEHAKVKWDPATQIVTVHEGTWAVCPAGLPDGHTCAQRDGRDHDDLFRKRVVERRAAARPSGTQDPG